MVFDKKARREIVMNETDVMTVLKVINHHLKSPTCRVGNCGWKLEPNMWFVMFDSRYKQWCKIADELKATGKFEIRFKPGGETDIVYMSK